MRTSTGERASQRKQFTENFKRPDGLSPQAAKTFPQGTIIAGAFKILSTIGEGGMGVVYLVEHVALNRRFALKVLSPELVNEQSWLRFQSEAKMLAALNHPIFVHVYDLGIHEQSVPFYSMDFLMGRSLEETLAEDGPMVLSEALDVFLELLDGLAYAHRNGIIHRDIKPGNIMICTVNGIRAVKLLDFGISKLLHSNMPNRQSLTSVGEIFGSPYYMSPEQCSGGSVDSRSDIYSVGCTLFEVLSGFVPFEGDSPLETAIMHQENEPPHICDIAPERALSQSIDLVLSKCLAKHPQDRYQSAKELAIDLTRVKENKEVLAYRQSPYAMAPDLEVAAQRELPLEGNTKQLLAVSIGLLLMVGTAGSCWWYLNRPLNSQQDTPRPLSTATIDNSALAEVENLAGGASASSFFNKTDAPNGSQLLTTPYSRLGMLDGTRTRFFDFPSDVLIGYFCQYDTSSNQPARGKCSYPASTRIVFCPTRTVARYPQYIKRFRNGDMAAFKIYSVDDADQVLAACTNLPEIPELRLEQCTTLTPACVDSLNKFSNLTTVDLSATSLGGESFAKATCWQVLKTLRLNSCEGVTPFLEKLSAINHLQDLSLQQSPLTLRDYKLISKMSNLRYLDISNYTLTLNELKQLTNLDIVQLNIGRGRLDQRVIPLLKQFKQLKRMTILPRQGNSGLADHNLFIAALKKGLPQVVIE